MTLPTSEATLLRPETALPSPPLASRSLAPDLARGSLLLFIALANVWTYLYGHPVGSIGERPLDGTAMDRAVDGFTALLIDGRTRPMFAILYGFGIATMAARLAARGLDARRTRAVLARRSLTLIVLGLAHAAMLFSYDILAPYGVTGLLALAFVHRSRTVLLRWFWGSLALMSAVFVPVLYGLVDLGEDDAPPSADYLASALDRVLGTAIESALSGMLMFFVPHVVIGIFLARAGWLTDPSRHRASLACTSLLAGSVALAGTLPYALGVAGLWHPEGSTAATVLLVHEISGIAAGLAYVCLFGWAAAAWSRRRESFAVRAVVATGERSLTCYLLQSVMLAPLLSAWGLGLGSQLGTAQAAGLAVLVWALTVAAALAWQRAGRAGPFEVLVRRCTYGPRRETRAGSALGARDRG